MSVKFTDPLDVCAPGLGKIYSDVFSDIIAQLKWPSDVPVVPDLVTVEDGQTYHLIVPSFFNMLMRLKLDGRRFNVVHTPPTSSPSPRPTMDFTGHFFLYWP